MPPFVWLLIWALVILVVAALYIREKRSGRKEVEEFDRNEHEAVRQAGLNLDARGPNGPQSTFLG